MTIATILVCCIAYSIGIVACLILLAFLEYKRPPVALTISLLWPIGAPVVIILESALYFGEKLVRKLEAMEARKRMEQR